MAASHASKIEKLQFLQLYLQKWPTELKNWNSYFREIIILVPFHEDPTDIIIYKKW